MDHQLVNPLQISSWDEALLRHPEATLFHSSQWARVLHESYAYAPLYVVGFEGGAIRALLPLMGVHSALTGRRGVSLPFTDYCRPLVHDGEDFSDLLAAAVDHGKRAGWRSVEVRSDGTLPPGIPPSASFWRHTLDLASYRSDLEVALRDSTRRSARKAADLGVSVAFETTAEALRHFFRLNCLTRKRHGLPPQPFSFFEKLRTYILSRGQGTIALARYREEVVAGAVFLSFGKWAIFKYGASDYRWQHLRANNLVFREAIRRYATMGCATMCLGRTDPQHHGLLQFKRGWGGREERMDYCRFSLERSTFVREPSSTPWAFSRRVFRFMPIPVLRLTGSLLYRHAG